MIAPYISFRTADIQQVVDWLVATPLLYRDTHPLIKILIGGVPYQPDVMTIPVEPQRDGPDPKGMT